MSGYPFSAIVGQDLLKKALLLAAVDPTIGGVLIRGDKGTAKSTAARGLSELLPAIAATPGCAFNCDGRGEALIWCDVCSSGSVKQELLPVPFITLPLGATEDRVLGTLDFEKALKEGRRRFQPGLLASAHRGILYIDEVNLLADHLVDVLLDAAAMGVNTVQREGLSVVHPARVTLIGTMNPEEGDLRPQLLDRFGMMVEVTAPTQASERAAVVRSRLSYEANPQQFRAAHAAEQADLGAALAKAMAALPEVVVADEMVDLISSLCCQLKIASLRADIVMTKVVRALAALDGRPEPQADDVKLAARLVLAHRRRAGAFDRSGLDEQALEEALEESLEDSRPKPQSASANNSAEADSACSDNGAAGAADVETPQDGEPPTENSSPSSSSPDEAPQVIFAPQKAAGFHGRLKIDNSGAPPAASAGGLRATARIAAGQGRGRYVRAVPDSRPASLAVDATIRHAVVNSGAESGKLAVRAENLHTKVREELRASLIVIAVDASGSMAAMRRMEAVKGAVLSLLEDAYRKRDQVCVIAFRGEQADLLLPPTRSVQIASQALKDLPSGGRTPLADGLSLALKQAVDSRSRLRLEPLVVVLTDGKGNVPLSGHENALSSAVQIAEQIGAAKLASLVIDTEDGFVRMGLAKQLSAAMGAEYISLDKLNAESLTLTIASRLKLGNSLVRG